MQSVLAVDDSPSIRSLVTYVLEQAGFNVVVAEDGREALEYGNCCTNANLSSSWVAAVSMFQSA